MIDADVRRAYETDGVVCLRRAFDAAWLGRWPRMVSLEGRGPRRPRGHLTATTDARIVCWTVTNATSRRRIPWTARKSG